MANIFEYADYREFLRDWIEAKKRRNPAISSRWLAQKAGLKSTGHVSMILNGKANISSTIAHKLSAALGLRKRESDFFQHLVLFTQAKTPRDKRLFFEKMAQFKGSCIHRLKTHQYAFYDKWHHSALRALLEFHPDSSDHAALGHALVPTVSADEVKASLDLMESLGLIRRNDDGTCAPTDALITTGSVEKSIALNKFMSDTLELARRALEDGAAEKRNMSVLTLGISDKGFEAIQEELREFRRRVMRIAEKDRAERVFQFSCQLFPLSKKAARRKAPEGPKA
jgi:uncharacterized protein (TIGR02147 family)